ncbi:MAG: hypothetical protein JWR18_4307 [Segetibacter sp.]|jgi:hypothetical protein|nr:hypothetical protein [Segetibacter sp.]
MKQIKKSVTFSIFFFTVIIFVSCKKSSEPELGIPKIYMPQAAVRDGGSTNNYPVPWSTTNGTRNYVFDSVNNTIEILLGVYRPAVQNQNSFTVDVIKNVDTTNKLIANGTITNAVILPSDVYSLPATVTVAEGQSEAMFHLKIDRKILIDKYLSYSGKKLVLAVGIANPSKYELNKSLTTTIIIIDSKVFLPPPPVINLIKGGDMELTSQSLWTVFGTGSREFGFAADKPKGTSGGSLRLFGDDATDVNGSIYQAVPVEVGKKYELSAKVKIPGGGNQFWLLFMVSDVVPGTATWNEANNAFMGINTWWNCGKTALDDDIRVVGCEGQGLFGNGIATKGIFTATKSTMYVAIQLGKSAGTFGGNILIDDVKLIKVD